MNPSIITVGANADVTTNFACEAGGHIVRNSGNYPCDLSGQYLGVVNQGFTILNLSEVRAYNRINIVPFIDSCTGDTAQNGNTCDNLIR